MFLSMCLMKNAIFVEKKQCGFTVKLVKHKCQVLHFYGAPFKVLGGVLAILYM